MSKEENKACLVELDTRDSVNVDRKADEETEDLHYIKEVCALPGEVEEDLPAYIPAFCHRTQLELSSDMGHREPSPPHNTQSQGETEEVVPFSLDDTFDYNSVALSHKYHFNFNNCGSS